MGVNEGERTPMGVNEGESYQPLPTSHREGPMYDPKPIDTSNIVLPDEVVEVAERLAENAHEIWAVQRMNDGWTYGSTRNDDRKEHPCLVPYNELPESEKEYDRQMASETLKAIIALGYRITR